MKLKQSIDYLLAKSIIAFKFKHRLIEARLTSLVDIVFVFSLHVDMSLDGVEIIANDRSMLTLCLVSVLMWTCLWMVSRSLLMITACGHCVCLQSSCGHVSGWCRDHC